MCFRVKIASGCFKQNINKLVLPEQVHRLYYYKSVMDRLSETDIDTKVERLKKKYLERRPLVITSSKDYFLASTLLGFKLFKKKMWL